MDLVEIAVHLYRQNPVAADRVLDRIEKKCRSISDFPEMGRRREELGKGLRSFPVGKYVIFYRPRADGIEIIRVLHGARDLPPLMAEE